MNAPLENHQPSRIVLPVVLSASAALHLALLWLPLSLSMPKPAHRPAPAPITLINTPSRVAEPVPEVVPQEIEKTPEPDSSQPPMTAQTKPREPVDRQHRIEPPETSAAHLRQQAMEITRSLATEKESRDNSGTLAFTAVPALPGGVGWLNEYVGTVPVSIDRWQGRDGSQHSRIVLASGDAVCTRTRPLTMQEFFNPWMSAAVPMVSRCGRERPQAVDRTDPWQRLSAPPP